MSNLEKSESDEIEEALKKNKEHKIEKKEETKKERFERLSSKRLENVLDKIRVLGNCSNKALYDYNFKDTEKIIKKLSNSIQKLQIRFHFPIQTLEKGNTILIPESNDLVIYCPKHKDYFKLVEISEHTFFLECDCTIQISKIDRYNGKYLKIGKIKKEKKE